MPPPIYGKGSEMFDLKLVGTIIEYSICWLFQYHSGLALLSVGNKHKNVFVSYTLFFVFHFLLDYIQVLGRISHVPWYESSVR